jgi:hypothetical protein
MAGTRPVLIRHSDLPLLPCLYHPHKGYTAGIPLAVWIVSHEEILAMETAILLCEIRLHREIPGHDRSGHKREMAYYMKMVSTMGDVEGDSINHMMIYGYGILFLG